MNQSVLLHICCACCSTSVIEQLKQNAFSVTGYFYNPNIYPEEEYRKREDDLKKIEEYFSIRVLRESYDHTAFLSVTKGFEQEKEGGERCARCFELRLRKTYETAIENNLSFFTSTLSVSAYKDFDRIKTIGIAINKDCFLAVDFKKRDGFKKSVELSRQLGLYRQKYCGCEFSMR